MLRFACTSHFPILLHLLQYKLLNLLCFMSTIKDISQHDQLVQSRIGKEACLFYDRLHLRIISVNICNNIVSHDLLFPAFIVPG